MPRNERMVDIHFSWGGRVARAIKQGQKDRQGKQQGVCNLKQGVRSEGRHD